MPSKKPRRSQQAEPTPDLETVLRQNGGVLPLPELFAYAGYNRDLPEHVELFYLALRETVGASISQAGDLAENARLEVIRAA